jgi:hypothetical protein
MLIVIGFSSKVVQKYEAFLDTFFNYVDIRVCSIGTQQAVLAISSLGSILTNMQSTAFHNPASQW